MINKVTKWYKKDRVNVESDLEFDGGTKHILPVIDSRYAFGVDGWAVSFIFDTTTPTSTKYVFDIEEGGTQQIYMTISVTNVAFLVKNADTFTSNQFAFKNSGSKISVLFQFDGTDYKAYFNTIEVTSLASTNPGASEWNFTSSAVLSIGSRATGVTGLDSNISQFCWFNRALTYQEFSYMHINGGILPESAHEACVVHYPLTQRQYFKASADFIVKHTQFSLDDLIALDVVEQYNYAKQNEFSQGAEANLISGSGFGTVVAFVANEKTGTGDFVLQWNFSDLGNNNVCSFGLFTGTITSYSSTRYHVNLNTNGSNVFRTELGVEVDTGQLPANFTNGIVLVKIKRVSGVITMELHDSIDGIVFTYEFNASDNTDYSIGGWSLQIGPHIFYNPMLNGRSLTKESGAYTFSTNGALLLTLKANHGELINFSDAEVGADNEGESTSIKDFYNKDNLRPYGLKFNGTNQRYKNETLSSTIGLGEDNWSIYVEGYFDELQSGNALIVDFKGALNQRIYLDAAGNRLKFVVQDGNGSTWQIGEIPINIGKFFKVLFIKKDNVITNAQMFINNKEIAYDTQSGSDLLGGRIFDFTKTGFGAALTGTVEYFGSFFDCMLFNTALTQSERNELFSNKKVIPTSLVDRFIPQKGLGTITSTVLANVVTQINFSVDDLANDNIWLEADSLLPEIKQAFNIDNSFAIASPIDVGNTIGTGLITSLISLKLPNPLVIQGSQKDILRIVDGHRLFASNTSEEIKFVAGKLSAVYTLSNIQYNILNIFIYRDNSSTDSGTLSINGDDFYTTPTGNVVTDCAGFGLTIKGIEQNTEILRCAVWNRMLTIKEQKELSNNILLKNPTVKQQEGMVCYYNMNLASFSEDGSDVLLKDYSSNGYDAIVTGLTGATSADKLADVPNHLIDINELR